MSEIERDAVPTDTIVHGVRLWVGTHIHLRTLPDGHSAMMCREHGGWLVGRDEELDAALDALARESR